MIPLEGVPFSSLPELFRAAVEATDQDGGVSPRAVSVHPRSWVEVAVNLPDPRLFYVAGIPVRLDPYLAPGTAWFFSGR